MIEELQATYSAKEKAELLLSNLEKLKDEVSAVEAQYNVLSADYTRVCDEAIAKINVVKTALEKDIKNKVGILEISKPAMSNLEARFRLGLVPTETYLKEAEIPSKNISQQAGLQLIIDKMADSIEFGLNFTGNGIISLGEKISNVCTEVLKVVTRKC